MQHGIAPEEGTEFDPTQIENQLPREEARDAYLRATGGLRKTGHAFGLGSATDPFIGHPYAPNEPLPPRHSYNDDEIQRITDRLIQSP